MLEQLFLQAKLKEDNATLWDANFDKGSADADFQGYEKPSAHQSSQPATGSSLPPPSYFPPCSSSLPPPPSFLPPRPTSLPTRPEACSEPPQKKQKHKNAVRAIKRRNEKAKNMNPVALRKALVSFADPIPTSLTPEQLPTTAGGYVAKNLASAPIPEDKDRPFEPTLKYLDEQGYKYISWDGTSLLLLNIYIYLFGNFPDRIT